MAVPFDLGAGRPGRTLSGGSGERAAEYRGAPGGDSAAEPRHGPRRRRTPRHCRPRPLLSARRAEPELLAARTLRQAPPVKRGLAEVADSILRRNIRKWEESRQRETWRRIRNNETPVAREVCGFLWRHLQRLRLDSGIGLDGGFDQAHEIVADAIRGRRFWFVVDAYGRIHTPLTNLPRLLRAHLAVEGRRLVGVDIGESQPLFIGLALATAAGDTTGREEEQEAGRGGDGHHRDTSLMLGTTMLGKSTGRLFDRAGCPATWPSTSTCARPAGCTRPWPTGWA